MRKIFKAAVIVVVSAVLPGCNSDGLTPAQSRAPNALAQSISTTEVTSNNASSGTTETYVINGLPITESSGLARSNLNKNLFWTHNDSGGNVALYALTNEGSHVATFNVQGLGVTNLDWEDMTSAILDDKSWLFIADVGDNNAFRPFTTVYMLPEPGFDIPRFGIRSDVVNVHRIFNLVFPNGQPRDVESLGVDAATQTAYLISKREAQPRLFSFPLQDALSTVNSASRSQHPPIPELRILSDHGPINIPRAPANYQGNPESFNWVTTMDISADGQSAYVGTLVNGYVYKRANTETWLEAFKKPPREFALPPFSQIEAGSFDQSASAVYVTSENYPARMAKIPLR